MTANLLGILFGIILIAYGLFAKGEGYNDVEMPLREDERANLHRPLTRWGRVSFVVFGCALVGIAILRKFNW